MSAALTRLATEINDHFRAADVAADADRIEAGRRLLEAQRLVISSHNPAASAVVWRTGLKPTSIAVSAIAAR